MPTTWVVVANRSEARIYENQGPGKGLSLARAMPHPEGRLKGREIETDRPSRDFAAETEPTEHIAQLWAKEIGTLLDGERARGAYERLVLVAEPHFLGLLQKELGKPTRDRVVGTLPKELRDVAPEAIAARVGEVIAV